MVKQATSPRRLLWGVRTPDRLGERQPDGKPGKGSGSPWWPPHFFLALVVKLGAVWARGLPPGRRTAEGGLVETVIQGVNSRTELASPPVCTGLESCAFHARPVRAALENHEAYRSGPGGGGGVIGAASKTALCHVIFFRYQMVTI